MKLTVLGGAAAGGNTGSGSSGYLIESGDSRLLIDPGPGTLPVLRRYADFRELTGVVVSHWHVDHFLDLAALRFAMAYNPRPAPGRSPLLLPPGGAALLRRFGEALEQGAPDHEFFDQTFSIREFPPGSAETLDCFTLQFHPTKHYVPCWAVRVHDSTESKLGYTADTAPLPALEEFFRDVDLLVSESTLLEQAPDLDMAGHLTATEAGALATASGAGALLLTHLWEELGFKHYEEQARHSFAGPIHLARPGLSLMVGSPRS
jgi:ribonuclease BN (tRNA processing enzyme)